MSGRVTARVGWWRDAWWVFAQGPGITNASGRKTKRIGPTAEDKERAEAVADALRNSGGASAGVRGPLSPLPTDRALEDWLETYQRTLKPSTEQVSRSLIRCHLAPFFADRDLREITEADLLRFADAKLAQGRSVALVENALGILRRVLNLAQREGLLDRHPATRLGELIRRLERREAREVRQVAAWTREEVAAILEMAREKEPRVYPVLVLLFQTGARRGEALGLQWSDVDLARGVLQIRRSRVRDRTGTPKSGKGRRMAVSAALTSMLGELRAEQRRKYPWPQPDGWVFLNRDGVGPMGETVVNRAWQRLRRGFAERGVRLLTLHSARHTWATLALQAGKSVRWVAEQLGHADPAMTLRVYAHATPAEEADLSFLDFGGSCSASNCRATGGGGEAEALRAKSGE